MKKIYSKMRGNERGTALLVALLVMGVLIAISLSLSSLILREIRSTKEIIDAGRAYYAAESAVEEALYYLDTELPGWDTEGGTSLGEVGDYSVFEYEVKNKCNAYPCLDVEEYDFDAVPLHKFYDVLELNENISIPLFTVEKGKVVSVKDFTVEFFANFDPGNDLLFDGGVSGWDVLRWKVFGMSRVEGKYVTESIHDFTAVSTGKNGLKGSNDFLTNADKPSWFGTKSCSDGSGDRITNKIVCEAYRVIADDEGNVTYCNNTEARDYYLYDGGEFISRSSCYPIATFMGNNQAGVPGAEGPTGLNYLSLTNMMNPSMFDSDVDDKRGLSSRLYFRVETYDRDMPREYASVVADGYSGDLKQSIEVQIKKDSYMPVFNFSLYSTYTKE